MRRECLAFIYFHVSMVYGAAYKFSTRSNKIWHPSNDIWVKISATSRTCPPSMHTI